MPHWLDKVVALLQAETADLRELARIAGADPSTFYRGINLDDLDLSGQNLEGMEFATSLPPRTEVGDQLHLDLPIETLEFRPQLAARKIKGARRQEERAALLLAEFLQDRSRGVQILENYVNDKAMLTNSVLGVLSEIRSREITGKKFTPLQIARKVSGRFARAEDKRAVLTYFFAKYLHQYPDIRAWLRGKSVAKLTGEQLRELRHYLEDE